MVTGTTSENTDAKTGRRTADNSDPRAGFDPFYRPGFTNDYTRRAA